MALNDIDNLLAELETENANLTAFMKQEVGDSRIMETIADTYVKSPLGGSIPDTAIVDAQDEALTRVKEVSTTLQGLAQTIKAGFTEISDSILNFVKKHERVKAGFTMAEIQDATSENARLMYDIGTVIETHNIETNAARYNMMIAVRKLAIVNEYYGHLPTVSPEMKRLREAIEALNTYDFRNDDINNLYSDVRISKFKITKAAALTNVTLREVAHSAMTNHLATDLDESRKANLQMVGLAARGLAEAAQAIGVYMDMGGLRMEKNLFKASNALQPMSTADDFTMARTVEAMRDTLFALRDTAANLVDNTDPTFRTNIKNIKLTGYTATSIRGASDAVEGGANGLANLLIDYSY